MKPGIHPQYHQAKVTCACGNSFEVGATVPEIKVEICNMCHPFFTGKQKFIDTAGRIDRFKARLAKAEVTKIDKKVKVAKSEAEAVVAETNVEPTQENS